MFRLDKKAFKAQSFKEADNTTEYWLSKTVDERFEAAFYLQSIAYGFDPKNPPHMQKHIYSERKHSD